MSTKQYFFFYSFSNEENSKRNFQLINSTGALITVIRLKFTFMDYTDTFTAEKIGIMFSYSVYLQKNVGYFFMACSDMENKMISMERCVEYTAIPIEKPFTLKSDKNIKKLRS